VEPNTSPLQPGKTPAGAGPFPALPAVPYLPSAPEALAEFFKDHGVTAAELRRHPQLRAFAGAADVLEARNQAER
jgi:hypothetical protein